jgi:two-component system, chemotaxis family, sensor kinase CheA
MDRDDLSLRLRATFIEEMDEQVRGMNRGLLALEQRPRDAEVIRSLFRAAHTIKGAARVAGVSLVEEACHALESVFAAARDGAVTLDGSHFSLLFAVVDALVDAGTRLRSNAPLEDSPLAAILPRLLAATTGAVTPVTSSMLAAPPPVRSAQPQAEAPAPPPVAEAAAAEDSHSRADASEEMVRVRAERLDVLLSAVGELIVATGRIAERSGDGDDDTRRLRQATRTVADVVRGLRVRPFSDICEALPRAVRDVAAASGKEVELELAGQDVEADRLVVDALREPLLHLVRNAVDHGIETPAERERAGKARTGHVRVAAELTAGRLVVTVADDGGGVDERAVVEVVTRRGGAAPRTREEIADALLAGGITSRREATTISGRGVGIDLVSSALERIGGTVNVDWQSGAGTVFTLECPPSPATLRALLVGVSGHLFALPTSQIERLRRVRIDELPVVEGRIVLPTKRGAIPIHALATVLGPPLAVRETATGGSNVVVLSAGGRRAGLVVDELVEEEEIVVRPLDVEIAAVPYATGAAVLPSGRIALVLAPGPLLAAAYRSGTAVAPSQQAQDATVRRRVIVADDSITTRTLEQSVLEAAGYEVMVAVNGEDAWQKLAEHEADLLVADVEMPRLDGIALCRRVRASQRYGSLPIVLVTGLASDEDRARGLDAGADAYIVKSNFDQADLLHTVKQLIGDE